MASAAKPKAKRKRVVLSIKEKVEILKLLDKCVSCTVVAEKYGIGRSTVADIKKNKEKILQFKSEMVDMGVKRAVKAMKIGEDKQLDQAVYLWFKQKRMEGVPVSGGIIREKAIELNRKLHGESTFKASEGWKWRFCQRHGIRKLSVQGEKLSGNKEEADKFIVSFRKLVQEKNVSQPNF